MPRRTSARASEKDLVGLALAEGRTILTEIESKLLLADYGVASPKGEFVTNLSEAHQAAERLGYPVVLKAVSNEISHKSEVGGVSLGLTKPEHVASAYAEILDNVAKKARGAKITGLFIQEMVDGGLELIIGAKRDKTFGLTLVFGLGGIFTELLRDFSVRLYPCNRNELTKMIEEIGASAMLAGYRGTYSFDSNEILDVLEAVGQMFLEDPRIQGADLNPVVANKKTRRLVSLDARLVIAKPTQSPRRQTVESSQLKPLFEPNAIAVVGASENPNKIAGMIVPNLLRFGFDRSHVFPVNANYPQLNGVECYPSILKVPGNVDLVCIAVPPHAVAGVLSEAGKKGARSAIIFSSGFEETGKGDEQQKLVEIARQYGMRICGPNTQGIISTGTKMMATFSPTLGFFSKLPIGRAALITQSGGLLVYLVGSMIEMGIGISHGVSSANEADLDVGDYLNFFVDDPKTEAIGIFLEGIRDGPKFLDAALRAHKAKKPIVVIKAGRSEKAALAARFHTGAMTGSYDVYQAMFKQAGIVEVQDINQVCDLLMAFTLQPIPRGKKLVVVSASGGANTLIADLCKDFGIELEDLSDETKTELQKIMPDFAAIRNPMDLSGQALGDSAMFENVLKIVAKHEGDFCLVLRVGGGTKAAEIVVNASEAFKKSGKALFACWMTPQEYGAESRKVFIQNGIPVYSTPRRAMEVIAAMVDYRERLDQNSP